MQTSQTPALVLLFIKHTNTAYFNVHQLSFYTFNTQIKIFTKQLINCKHYRHHLLNDKTDILEKTAISTCLLSSFVLFLTLASDLMSHDPILTVHWLDTGVSGTRMLGHETSLNQPCFLCM